MTEKRYAILDTDFVSKANIIRTDSGEVLADRILAFPGYKFACHELMLSELSRHGTRPAQEWMVDKVTAGVIRKYTDSDILDLLHSELGNYCYQRYLSYLKQSCDVFAANYFEDKYASLIELVRGSFSKEQFLSELSVCDAAIGPQQSLGEKKAFLLLLVLRFVKGEEVFLFCSDDFGARKGLSDAAGIPCISIIAVFWKLKQMGVCKEEAFTYFRAFCDFCSRSGQTTLRVWEYRGTNRRKPMPLMDVFDGLYEDKFALMKNGDLLIRI